MSDPYSAPHTRPPLLSKRRIVDAVLYIMVTATTCQIPVYAADNEPVIVAATGGIPSTDLADAGGTLQEVVVSARKRQEDAQTVPISIVAISGDQLEQSHAFLAGDIVHRGLFFRG